MSTFTEARQRDVRDAYAALLDTVSIAEPGLATELAGPDAATDADTHRLLAVAVLTADAIETAAAATTGDAYRILGELADRINRNRRALLDATARLRRLVAAEPVPA